MWNPLETLSEHQRRQLALYEDLLRGFNGKINLISRDTEDEIWERHLLHALALTAQPFPAGSRVVDWGTGGGLPAIPLAIAFPEVRFYAVDAVGKKIQAVRTMARRLELENLEAWQGRAEAWPGRADYSVSRATAPLLDLWSWHDRVREDASVKEGAWPAGLLCLKGGDLREETQALLAVEPSLRVTQEPLYDLLGRPYFRDKYLVTVTAEG